MDISDSQQAPASAGAGDALRQNGGMPARLPSPEGMPLAAERAQALFASRGRMAVVQHLLAGGPATRSALGTATGLSKDTLFMVLRELEAAGFVTVDIDVAERHGRTATFTADAASVAEAIASLTSWVLGTAS